MTGTRSEEAPIDAELIREHYRRGLDLWSRPVTEEEVEQLRGLLLGHVQLLLPEVEERAARMRGFMRGVAVHVVLRGYQTVEEGQVPDLVGSSYFVEDLAVAARSLLVLWENPGPLGSPKGREEIARAVRRRLCGDCLRPIAEGEESEPILYGSDSGAAVRGLRHVGEDCLTVEERRETMHAVP